MGEIFYLPPPEKLTPEQREHWETQLEIAKRAVEYALRQLRRAAIERGLNE